MKQKMIISGAEEDININQMLLEKLKLIPGLIENGVSPSRPTPTSELVESTTPPQVTHACNWVINKWTIPKTELSHYCTLTFFSIECSFEYVLD
jgi:hypothetical protein